MSRKSRAARRRVGRVSVFEHHGSFYTFHTGPDGPVRRRVEGGAAQAEYEASLLNARLVASAGKLELPAAGAGEAITPASITVGELRRRFLHHHEHVLGSAVATVARYRSATLYLEDHSRRQGWDAPTVEVGQFLEHLRRVEVAPNGHRNTAKRRLRDKGIRYILEICRSMYHFGNRHGALPVSMANPSTRFGLGRLRVRDAKQVFVFDAAQELAFLSAATLWAFTIHFTLAKTGLRPGELCHLLIEDLDLTAGWLHVRGKPELGWSVKTGRDRRVPLLPEVVAVVRIAVAGRAAGPVFLRERFDIRRNGVLTGDRTALAAAARRRLAALGAELGRTPTRDDAAECHRAVWREAGAADVDRVRTTFLAAARRAGLPAAATCPKSWRHTFATLLQEANVDPLIRQETLGHKPASADASAIGMTGVYTHTTPELQKREIDRALRLRPDVLRLAHQTPRVCDVAAKEADNA
jgi:integrase